MKHPKYGEECIRCRVPCDSWHMCPKCYFDIIDNGTKKQARRWEGVLMWREGLLK